MTITVHLEAIVTGISTLSVSGVTMCDIDAIPTKASTNLPVFFPRPQDFVTNLVPKRVTYGNGTIAKIDLEYDLNYQFLYAMVGSGGSLLASYADMIALIALIVATILANDAVGGAVDIQLNGISNIGPLPDPGANAMYHGAEISLHVLEFAQ